MGNIIFLSDQIFDEKKMEGALRGMLKGNRSSVVYTNEVCKHIAEKVVDKVVIVEKGSGLIPDLCVLWWDGINATLITPYKEAFPAIVMNNLTNTYEMNYILIGIKNKLKR